MDSHYQAYLLRLRRGQDQPHWRATLENAQTGALLQFATEREMLLFLMQSLTVELPNIDDQAESNDSYPTGVIHKRA